MTKVVGHQLGQLPRHAQQRNHFGYIEIRLSSCAIPKYQYPFHGTIEQTLFNKAAPQQRWVAFGAQQSLSQHY